MSRNTKLLFLTPQLPFPPKSGGVIKSYHLLQHAAEHYDLTLACLLKGDDDPHSLQQHMPDLNMLTYVMPDIPRNGWNFVRSWLVQMPLTIFRNYDAKFKTQIANIINDFDVVLVDQYLMFQYIPQSFKGRVVLHQHNAEYQLWLRMSEQVVNWLKKQLIFWEANRIARYEANICVKADAVLAAPNDQLELSNCVKSYQPASHVNFYLTYHLGDESNLYLPALDFEQTQEKLLFIGTLSWQPNWDGLLWFIDYIWPLIKAAKPEVIFTIVGGYTTEQQKLLSAKDDSIVLAGFVKDLEPYFQSHRVFVAPLTFGSGIKVKVVNSMYRGLPLVTTNIGAESLEVKHGEHMLIADKPNDFAEQVLLLLDNKVAWQRLSESSRALCCGQYTWQQVYQHFDRAICGVDD